jgi:hypothetical protein
MHTHAYLFRLLRRGTTIIVTTCSNVIGCPFFGKVLVEVGLIVTGQCRWRHFKSSELNGYCRGF